MSGAITAAVVVAGATAYSVSEASDSADAATAASIAGTEAATASADANLDFQVQAWEASMEDLNDLESIFGPVRENLDAYYKDMTPERFQLQGKESLENQYARSNEQLDAMFSNNGMYGSGQQLSAQVALENQREVSMGANQQNALSQYNAEQTQWLSMGINEENAIRGVATNQQGTVSSAYNQQGNTAMTGASQLSGAYNQEAQNYGSLASAGIGMLGYAAGSSFGTQTTLDSTSLTSADYNYVNTNYPTTVGGY